MVATMSETANSKNLGELRKSIDEIDAAIVKLLAERMAICKQVAAVKAESATAVMQPQRVREVLNVRRQWAIDRQVDPDFTEQLFRILLAETHRIEIAEDRTEPAPTKTADALRSALDTVACRIDHVVVAVNSRFGRSTHRHRSAQCWFRATSARRGASAAFDRCDHRRRRTRASFHRARPVDRRATWFHLTHWSSRADFRAKCSRPISRPLQPI